MDGLFRLDIVSQDDGMFVVKTGCVDGNGLKQVAVVSANKLEDVASDNPDKLKAEIADLLARIRALEEAVEITPEESGRIMHESWSRTKRDQGYHHQSEMPTERKFADFPPVPHNCDKCHPDLIPWEKLPEKQKDINRHAFDDVLEAIRRRAGRE